MALNIAKCLFWNWSWHLKHASPKVRSQRKPTVCVFQRMQHGIVETTASGTTTVTTRPAATSWTPARSFSKVRELRSPPSSTSADTCCHYSLSGLPSSSSSTLSEQTLALSPPRHQCHPLLTTIQSFTSKSHSVHSKYFPLNLHFVMGLIQKRLYSCYNMFTCVGYIVTSEMITNLKNIYLSKRHGELYVSCNF